GIIMEEVLVRIMFMILILMPRAMFMFLGASYGTTYNLDCFAKLNSAGVQQWLTRYPSASNSESQGSAIAVDASGNVYVAGFIDPPSVSPNWLVLKYNSTGTQQWVDLYNGPLSAEDKATDIVIAPNGNPTVCGYHWDSTALGGVNTLVRQYNTTGGVVWQSTYTNPAINGFDQAYKLAYTANGELRVAYHKFQSFGYSY
ncbi:MAG: hypothetical protein IPP72_16645, partial [Chitinophagaceae bacterium]|nr:hypothetical protein [Chitinophagaceae bacterium]